MSYIKHDHPMYKDIMLKGNYDNPIRFDWPDKSVVITGEGGNRRIHIYDGKGSIQIPVDMHVYDRIHRAYIAPCEIRITGEPSAAMVLNLMQQLLFRSNKREKCFLYFTEDGLDKIFDFVCDEL